MTRPAVAVRAAAGHGAAVSVTASCVGCGACLPTCPERALRPVPGARAGAGRLLVTETCTGCLECVEVCPVDAIRATGSAA